MIKKKLIFIIILIALLPLVFITGQSSWLILDEVESDIENKYYPVSINNEFTFTYDGTYKNITANPQSSDSEIFDESKVRIEYFDSKDGKKGSKRSANPINAGMYYADTYYADTLIGTSAVTIKPYPIYIIPNDIAIDYGTSADNIDPGYKTYELLGDGSYREMSLFTNQESGTLDTLSFEYRYSYTYKQYDKVGEYEIGIDITPNTNTNLNYSLSTPKKSKLSVNKKHLSFTWDNLEFTYDGTIPNPSITINNNLASHGLTPIFSGNVSKDAGTYPITLQKEYENFILDGDPSLFNKNIVIKKRSIFKTNLQWSGGEFIYNGNSLYPIVNTDNMVDKDDVHCVYEFYSGATKLDTAPIDAGSYTIKLVGLSGSDSKNYTYTTGETSYTIKKAMPQRPAIEPLSAKVGDLISSLKLPQGFRLDGYNANSKFTTSGLVKVNVIYNPDSKNYNDLSTTLDVIVQEDDKIAVSIKFENTTVTYDGKVHHPSYQIYLDGVAGAMPDGAILIINYEKSVLSPTDAGTYRIVNVDINLPQGYSYMRNDPNNDYKNHTITINPLEVNMCSSLEMDYDGTARKFADFSNKLKAKLTFNNINGAQASVDLNAITINGMHNGVYAYGSVDRVGLDTTMSNVLGSTYLVNVSLNSNYKLNNNTLILKYKTAKCGNTLYTIEDAILKGSGEINFVGDATDTTSYVATSFTRLTFEEGNPYNDGKKIRSYFEVKRNLVVPYGPECNGSGDKTNRIHEEAGHIDAVYSALIIPRGVKLEFTSGAVLSIGAVILHKNTSYATYTQQRGVVINEGSIIMNNKTKIDCYGYLKGREGIVELKSGSIGVDCMRTYDWPGGSIAKAVYSNVFPISRWSLHNMSCTIRVYSGAEYQACAFIVASKVPFEKFVTVLGNQNSTNYLFKPTSNSGYIEKTTKDADNWKVNDERYNALYSITGSNQIEGQQDIISIYGDYADGTLSLSIDAFIIRVEIGTSLNKSLPLSYISVIAKNGTNLTLSKSDYLFLPGTKLVIEEGANLTVGSGVDMSFATMSSIETPETKASSNSFVNNVQDNFDAELLVNGTIKVTGNIGGKITSSEPGATLDISGAALKSNFQLLYGLKDPYFILGSVTPTGPINKTGECSNLTNIIYKSAINGNKVYWEPATNVKTFTLEFYDEDVLLETKNIQVIGSDTYTITGNEYSPTKPHYSFTNWSALDGSDIIGKTFNNTQPIKMKANWDLVRYTLNYTAGYGLNSDNKVNYVQAEYQNKLESFTINNFVNGVLQITTTATYQDKYFDGWYPGIDTSLGKKSTIITMDLLELMINAAPGMTDIPLFCNFTDKPTFEVVLVDDKNNLINGHYILEENDTLISKKIEINIDASKYDNDNKYEFYFDGFVDEMGNTYTLNAIRELPISSNKIFKVNWKTKLKFDFINFEDQIVNTIYTIPGNNINLLNRLDKEPTLGQQYDQLFTFRAWTSNGKEYGPNSEINLKESTTFKAVYDIKYIKKLTIEIKDATLELNGVNYSANKTLEFETSKPDEAITLQFKATTTKKGMLITINDRELMKGQGKTYNGNETINAHSTLHVEGANESCITADTLITMSDGSKKMVKDINVGDLVLVFNHESGMYEIAPVIVNAHEEVEWDYFIVTHLYFSDNTELKIINEHELFDLDLNRYVIITTDNASDFIGHRFYAASFDGTNYVEREIVLTNFENKVEYTGIYGPFTAYHMNCFTEEILTLPGEIHGLYNIFEFSDGLKYDEVKMKDDIEKYGLYTYDDFKNYVSQEVFDLLPAPYFKVAVGKGMVTYEQLIDLASKYMGAYNKLKE